jgi:hypothetical protein
MTDKSRILKLVGDVRPNVAIAPPAQRPRPAAAVLIFTPFRPKQYVEELVRLMLSVDRARGEYRLGREMQVIEEDLVGAGAEPAAVDRALRSLEAAVRAELWHAVLDGT